MTAKKVLLTGGSGFVGRGLLSRMSADGYRIVACSRTPISELPVGVINSHFDFLDGTTSWESSLIDTDVVIHLAARVHVMQDTSPDPFAEFYKVNVEGTLNLARQAAEQGVRRFIFISSIKVNGECTSGREPFLADVKAAPKDSYGISKLEAEKGLRALAVETGMEVVIIRPTLVYGPGVKANFFNMMRWLHKGIPLPFGAIYNQRSLVALDNLVDLIVTCVCHPAAANQTFLVSDGEDLSTTGLLRRMGIALGKPARLLPVPGRLLEASAAVLGRRSLSQRLCGSLQVNIDKTRELLNWAPPVSVDQALHKTAKHFLEQQCK
ncbi:SDR family oxidoreductase [Microbulbifer sp. MLAF003]|uniref:UDP-glucose 4-epimerase family protein n=1 Tax=unclassified Microbulbifer TaxID=2619833 RepID=UPI0024AE8057|nr:SDR family oxidoreductase [Microbulbifer sp. MLAF003]WHI52442.1 SDR family oxidoreductase [Microbulbifer sp. MLAF003]